MFADYTEKRTESIEEINEEAIMTNTKWNMGHSVLEIATFCIAVVALALASKK